MIFVTVGTHEQPFDRLLKSIDNLKKEGKIEEKVIIQSGYSAYKPVNCEWKKLYPYSKMQEFVEEARIVITHGGPSSFIMPLQLGKIPIVVPRLKKYGEHVNDHQFEFAKAVAERQHNIIVVENTDRLGDIIRRYDTIITSMATSIESNNAKFNRQFSELVNLMMSGEIK